MKREPIIPKSSQPQRKWWREPMVWLIGGLPLTAVVAGLTTVMIAFDKPDSLVGEGHIKEGMAVTEVRTQEDVRASELGIAADISQTGDQIGVTLKGFIEPLPRTLRLTVFHPTLADKDVVMVLTRANGTHYAGTLPEPDLGKRKYVLEPEDHAWRIIGEGTLSTSTSVMLAARLSHSSTHP